MLDLHDDDEPVGRILTRRDAAALLGGIGATGLLTLYGCSTSNKLDVDTVAQSQAHAPA